MDAAPVLAEIGRHLQSVKLEAVLIGNAAAALQGAPVTTVDFDFLYRKTSHNVSKRTGARRHATAAVLSRVGPVSAGS